MKKVFSFLPSERFKVFLLALRTNNSKFRTHVLHWEIIAKPTCVLHSSSSVLGCPAAFPPDGGRGPRPREGQGTVLMLLLKYSYSFPVKICFSSQLRFFFKKKKTSRTCAKTREFGQTVKAATRKQAVGVRSMMMN